MNKGDAAQSCMGDSMRMTSNDDEWKGSLVGGLGSKAGQRVQPK